MAGKGLNLGEPVRMLPQIRVQLNKRVSIQAGQLNSELTLEVIGHISGARAFWLSQLAE
jgi:hypothetical protein